MVETVAACPAALWAGGEWTDEAGRTALYVAVQWRAYAVVQCLLKTTDPVAHPPPVNRTGVTGHTPLHIAAFNGDDLIIAALCKAGAAVNMFDRTIFPHFTSHPKWVMRRQLDNYYGAVLTFSCLGGANATMAVTTTVTVMLVMASQCVV
eukprot:SAG31_NODE_20115_length_583_cov_1.088843_1_plen_150_part_00